MATISLLELRNKLPLAITGSNVPALLKSFEFQNAIITTEDITKPGLEVSTKKMSKGGRVILGFTSALVDFYEADNHIIEGTYSVPKVVRGHVTSNTAITSIVSKEYKPGLMESSTHYNSFIINLTGILAAYSDLGSVRFVFSDGSQEIHNFVNDKFQTNNNRFTITKRLNILKTGAEDVVLFVASVGESKTEIYKGIYTVSLTLNKELPNRLKYPNNKPNLFGSLSECTIIVSSKSGGVVYETKLPKITQSNDFVYYYINVSVRVNGNKCTLVNPPSWYKGPTTLDFERQSLGIPI